MDIKPKTCKSCGKLFTPSKPLQVVCVWQCAVKLTQDLKAKREAKEHRERKAKAKTRQEWMKEAQIAVNSYVRARDAKLGCVSCNKPASWNGQWHASHYRSVGAASCIRFNLWNIHKSCSVCNNWKSGNLLEYDIRLREKIGNEKVDWLRTQTQPRTFDVEYLKRIRDIFRKKTKNINKTRGSM